MCPDSRVTRRALLGAGIGVGGVVLAGCTSPEPEPPDDVLTIYHLDVGQADSTVLVTPEDETVVVDTGNWLQEGQTVLEYLDAIGVEHIDHLVATHAHADHIGGHAEIIEQFETEHDGIGFVYDSGVPHTTQTYADYIDAVDAYGHDLLVVEEGEQLPVAGVDVFALNPPAGDSGDDIDYNCVALQVEYDGVTHLMTGDAGSDAEQRMVSEWGTRLPSDIYQVGHHGSSTSSSEPFVETVDPDIAVASSAYDSQFGHPHDEVLVRFGEFDIETYWTGVHEETTVTVDGTVTTEPDIAFTTDPLELLADKPDSETARVPAGVDGSGGSRFVVDRVEDGRAVLLPLAGGGSDGRMTVAPERLPDGAGERSVVSVTVERGGLRGIEPDTAATEERAAVTAERLARLSRPLSDTR
jgi:competence protein ComEC